MQLDYNKSFTWDLVMVLLLYRLRSLFRIVYKTAWKNFFQSCFYR